MSPERWRISFAAAEAYPFAKVGGLADVACALPRALARRGHDVTLLLPAYPGVGPGADGGTLAVPAGRTAEQVRVLDLGRHHGVRVHAIASDRAFGRARIYGYRDDDARFALFAKAAVAHAAATAAAPDVLHANDWHLGLAPQYAREGPFAARLAATATVLTIHNLAYQGRHVTLTPEALGVAYAPGPLGRFADRLLARGIAAADAVSTVSHRYRDEILSPEHGEGLDPLLRRRRGVLRGILNGLDDTEFDPRRDPAIAARYDAATLPRRALNKAALQQAIGVEPDPRRPLIGMVSRLVDQKGVDVLCAALDQIADMGAEVVVMGLGDRRYGHALRRAAARRPARIAYLATEAEAVARRIYAGADLFLAPSRWEPCGLGPLIALRYGAIPVVRATGGLAETIVDVTRHPGRGLGFTFRERTGAALLQAVAAALDAYDDRSSWEALQRRGMAAEFSWDRAAAEYERLYRDALRRVRGSASPLTRSGSRAPA
jgi:starch synthase